MKVFSYFEIVDFFNESVWVELKWVKIRWVKYMLRYHFKTQILKITRKFSCLIWKEIFTDWGLTERGYVLIEEILGSGNKIKIKLGGFENREGRRDRLHLHLILSLSTLQDNRVFNKLKR